MSSANLVDFLTEKIFSFSSKMKDESLQHHGTSYLMCGNNSTHHWDPLKAVNVLKEDISDFEGNASFYPYILNQVLDILDSNHSFKFRQNLKPENLFSRSKIGFFSPHLLDLISDLNSYHCRNTYSDTSLVALSSIFLGNITNTLFNELPIMSQNPRVDFKSDTKSGNLPVNEVKMSLNIDQLPTDLLLQSPKMKQTSETSFDANAYSLPDTKSDNLSVNEVKMSLNIDQLPTDLLLQSPKMKQTSEASFNTNAYSSPVNAVTMSLDINQLPTHSDSLNEKCNLSTSVKLNLKLANRKTKQMNKRSKKRRRRQKKSLHSVNSNSDILLGNGDTNGKSQSPVSSRVCFIAESPDFECKISFQHSVKVPSFVSSFVVPVENSSDDDSEWESYDEIDYCKSSNLANCEVLSSTDSSPSKSMEYKCSVPSMKLRSSIMSFVVPVSSSSDDDSDWDACEPDTSFETPDFEFTGLFLTNLCTPRPLFPDNESKVGEASEDETNESFQLKKILIEANKNWDNLTNGDTELKSTSKVSFAPDEVLVEVFPVEMYERKGEWERFAIERLRFKRKIAELEKVLSPCFHPEHRTKVFKKLMASEL